MFVNIKLALDTQISRKAAHEVRMSGFDIVYHASKEPDEVWIKRSLEKGANLFVSPDLDIPNYLEKHGVDAAWIDVPQGLGGDLQAEYLVKQILRVTKNKLSSQTSFKSIAMGKFVYMVEHNYIDKFLMSNNGIDMLKNSYMRVKGDSITWGGTSGRINEA